MEPTRCRILIVGAGLAGAATAFHLRAAGVGSVILLEQEDLAGVHASGRNAAMVREHMDRAPLQRLASESAAALRTGELASYRATGGVLIRDGERRAHPDDGVIDVAGLLQRFLAGQDVRHGVRYEGHHEVEGGLRVETSAGSFEAEVLVNAAGAWAGLVGDLPLEARNRHLFVSAHDPAIDPQAPFVWDLDAGYYLRPESGGWLLCACDEAPAAPGAYEEDPAVLEVLGEKLRRHEPELADLRIARRWVGQRTFARDACPVLGFDPRCARLFHVAGLGGHGVTLSYAIGRRAAAMIVHGGAADAALDPARLLAAPLPEPRSASVRASSSAGRSPS